MLILIFAPFFLACFLFGKSSSALSAPPNKDIWGAAGELPQRYPNKNIWG
jgi:hypothetical protein